jgi:ADP-ribose pyrophosphatase YjhB (NUDIX family)
VTDPAVDDPPEPNRRTRLGAYSLCLDDRGRILLTRLSALEVDVGAWTMPGGGVEFGEHPNAAAIRELEEETGLAGEIVDVAGIFSHVYQESTFSGGGDLHFLGIVYRMRIVGGELRDEVDGTTDVAAWLTLDELRERRLVELARFAVGLAFPGVEL